MSGRKLNALEAKIHQTALQAGKPLTQKELDALAPDAAARTSAINFMLGAGLLKLMKDAHNTLLYRAVQKGEMDIKKGLTGEENMVLGHIQAAANQGIWTKHLKAKTELHQTVIDRCLKSLVQKQLIKAVKGVDKNRTRKIYMMAHLEPSVELTGGPWYTDSELDTEFIKLLCSACLRFIKERPVPDLSPSEQPLYAIGAGPGYPTTAQITNFLTKSKITETQLSEEHVEMLLNVLVLDGEVEKIPAFAAALFDANDILDGSSDSGSEADSEDDKPKKKKRKASKEASKSKSKKLKRNKDSGDDSDNSDAKTKKRKKRKRVVESDEGSGSEGESKKRKKKRKAEDSDASGSDDEDDNDTKSRSKSRSRSKSKSKSRKQSRHASSSDVGSASESESDSSSSGSDTSRHKRSRSKSKSSSRSSKPSKSKSKTKLRVRSSSRDADAAAESFSGGAWVYRAIRQERISLGWAEAPCARCPVFDFCKDGGPTNPRECEYFEEWLVRGVAPLGLEDS
ncbi:hypothetical protein EWM64_g9191 [Hericium alpestre]|uniref:DNA-directed RNA polymerase III subunit RPC6 n=1 Tax=Hericium alpestre TaxID=135208 RepID=A0A4Y9ZLX5_9AGAM|nr:hypothetical protein EWM64_g9191 [Hericium alpestre]